MVVLDASVVLAVINAEPGAEAAIAYLAEAVISAVNLSEVVAKLAERGMPAEAIAATLDDLDLDVQPLSRDLAIEAGLMRPTTRTHGLSLGDRACLALAHSLGETAVTMDRAWQTLDVGVSVATIER